MQFTKTAALAMCAGGILALHAMKHNKTALIPAVILLVLGMMLRMKCIYIVLPLLAVYVLIDLMKQRRQLLDTLKPYLLLFGCALLCYGAVEVSGNLYENTQSELQVYDDFNHERVAINDVKAVPYSEIETELTQIGVSENDYEMMLSWNFGDEAYFTTERLGKVADILADHQQISIGDALYSMVNRQYWNYFIFWFMMIAALIIMICFRSIPQTLLIGGMGVLLLFVNAYGSRNVYRVEIATIVSTALIYFYAVTKTRRHPAGKWTWIPAIVMLCFSFATMMPVHSQENYMDMHASWDNGLSKYQTSFRKNKLAIIEELQSHPENTYVLGFQSCIQSMYLNYEPAFDSGTLLLSNAVYLGGVDFNHPQRTAWMKLHSMENTMLSLLEPDVYLVEQITQNQLLTYFHEHYDEDITIELVKEVDGYQIWKFHKPE